MSPTSAVLDPGMRRWLADTVEALDPSELRAQVEAFPGPRSRIHRPDAMHTAEGRVIDAFSEAGWQVERLPFTTAAGFGIRDHGDFRRARYPNLSGANVIAVRPGEVSAALVVVAHLDTVRDSPGANDNTAAVVVLLNLARLLAPLRLRHTVVLAATDFEEIGLFGARALVPALRDERPLIGAINLETIAYVDRRPGTQRLPGGMSALYPRQVAALRRRGYPADFVALIHDRAARRLTATFAAGLAEVTGPEIPVPLRAPAEVARIAPLLMHVIPFVNNFARGDHVAFWEAGVPALQVTDTANFRYGAYHRGDDTPERLDYERLAAITAATAATIRVLAGPARGESEAGRPA